MDTPEGLKRERKGPLNKSTGRQTEPQPEQTQQPPPTGEQEENTNEQRNTKG